METLAQMKKMTMMRRNHSENQKLAVQSISRKRRREKKRRKRKKKNFRIKPRKRFLLKNRNRRE